MAELVIRPAHAGDIGAITALQNALLYEQAIEWTDTPHTGDERLAWLSLQHARGYPVLVAQQAGSVVAWASYGDFRDTRRWPGYRFTVEHTIHVHRDHWGCGIGTRLLTALIEDARDAGLHSMIGGIDGDNDASLRFHRRLGFDEVARMPEVGFKLGRWRTLVFVQLLLRRGALAADVDVDAPAQTGPPLEPHLLELPQGSDDSA